MPAPLVRQLRRRRVDVDSGFCNSPQRDRDSDDDSGQQGQTGTKDCLVQPSKKVPAEFGVLVGPVPAPNRME